MSSGSFKVERGVRQGDPLSPYLFIIGIELLASAIRENKKMNGIPLFDKLVKIILYVDNITIAVSDKKSAKIVLKIIDNFKTLSGLELNIDKRMACGWALVKTLKNNLLASVGNRNLLKPWAFTSRIIKLIM